MRLDSLEVEHFRAIQSARLMFGPGLNVVYGPNDLGKSTLTEAIRAAFLIAPPSVDFWRYALALLPWANTFSTRQVAP